jgi:hypothetical protein
MNIWTFQLLENSKFRDSNDILKGKVWLINLPANVCILANKCKNDFEDNVIVLDQ